MNTVNSFELLLCRVTRMRRIIFAGGAGNISHSATITTLYFSPEAHWSPWPTRYPSGLVSGTTITAPPDRACLRCEQGWWFFHGAEGRVEHCNQMLRRLHIHAAQINTWS